MARRHLTRLLGEHRTEQQQPRDDMDEKFLRHPEGFLARHAQSTLRGSTVARAEFRECAKRSDLPVLTPICRLSPALVGVSMKLSVRTSTERDLRDLQQSLDADPDHRGQVAAD